MLTGGGFRFGIYLGMYAALHEAGDAPDLLLATCGGALAANLIVRLPGDRERKAWLCSPQMYAFWCSLRAAGHARATHALAAAIGRKFARRGAATIPDLFEDYLFEVPAELPFPPLGTHDAPALAIIGGRMLFTEAEVGQARGSRKLFQETVFGDTRVASLLQGASAPFSGAQWGDTAIADGIEVDSDTAPGIAARISMADVYYFRCHEHGGSNYIGGVLDLFPVELAQRMAQRVTIEFKQSFDQVFAYPALRTVFGFDANTRLQHVHAQRADTWIDSSDVSLALAAEQVQKKIDWRRNQLALVAPPDHATYVQYMERQWQYGYARAREAMARTNEGMRKVTRYNRALACVS